MAQTELPKGYSFTDENVTLPKGYSFADVPPTEPQGRTIGNVISDMGVMALKSTVGLPQSILGLIDIPTGGNAGKLLEDTYRPDEAQKIMETWYSPEQQEANRRVREATGFVDTIKAGVTNPSAIGIAAGESVAQMLGGAGAARKLIGIGKDVGVKVAPWLAGAFGEGAMGAGSAEESIRSQTTNGLTTPEQSLSALASGIGTGVIGAIGGKFVNTKTGQRLGLADIDTMLAQGGANAVSAGQAKQGFIKSVVASGVSEGTFQEWPQSVQEQMWQNYALGKPLMDGTGNQGAIGLLTGHAMGHVAGGYNAMTGKTESAREIGAKVMAKEAQDKIDRYGNDSKFDEAKQAAINISKDPDLNERRGAEILNAQAQPKSPDTPLTNAATVAAQAASEMPVINLDVRPDGSIGEVSQTTIPAADVPPPPSLSPAEQKLRADQVSKMEPPALEAVIASAEVKPPVTPSAELILKLALEERQRRAATAAPIVPPVNATPEQVAPVPPAVVTQPAAIVAPIEQSQPTDLNSQIAAEPVLQADSQPTKGQNVQDTIAATQGNVDRLAPETGGAVGNVQTQVAANAAPVNSSQPTVNSDLTTTPASTLPSKSTTQQSPLTPLPASAPLGDTQTSQPDIAPLAAALAPLRADILKFKGEGKTVTGSSTIYAATDRLKAIADNTGDTSLKGQQVWFQGKSNALEKNGDIEAATLFRQIVENLKKHIKTTNTPAPVKIDPAAIQAASDAVEKTAEVVAPKPKRKVGVPKTMSMLQFVASIGGFDRAGIAKEIGLLDDMKRHKSGIFGSPAFRVNGGIAWDRVGEALAEAGYLPKNEHGQYDKSDLEDKIRAELGGDKQYKVDDVIDNAEAEKASRELDDLRTEAESVGVDWKKYKTADDLYVAIDAKKFALNEADETLLGDAVASESADTDFDFGGTVMTAAQTDAWLNGVENGQGNQGQADGTTTGTQGEGNQRSAERGSTQGEAQQQTPTGEFALTSQTNEEVIAQEEAAKQAKQEEEAAAKNEQAAKDKADIDARKKKHAEDASNFVFGESSKDSVKPMGNLFNQPSQTAETPAESPKEKPLSEMTPADLLRAAADKMDAESKPEVKAEVRASNTTPKPLNTDQAAIDQANSDFDDALGDLGDIVGRNFRATLTPEQEQKLLPVLTKLFDAAFRKGYYKFKEAARYVLDAIKARFGVGLTDEISLDSLQGAYIGMAGRYKDQGADKPRDVVSVESKDELGESNVTDKRSSTNLERDSENADPEDDLGEESISDGRGGNVESGGQGIRGAETKGGTRGSSSISGREAVADGEYSDLEIHSGDTGSVTPASIARDSLNQRSDSSGLEGSPVESDAASVIDELAESGLSLIQAKQAQIKADKAEHKPGLANIRETLPILTPGQQEDVHIAETRFAQPEGYGMLFTNGTGTGKTFTGAGIVKRFDTAGKHNTLIVVPSEKIASDWQNVGKLLRLNISQLLNTKDAGSGIVITTYANLGLNNELVKRDWDLIVTDESHRLKQEAQGSDTGALNALRALSLHPSATSTRHSMLNAEDIARMLELDNKIKENGEYIRALDTPEPRRLAAKNKVEQLNNERTALRNKLSASQEAIKSDVAARQGDSRTRVLFLSATPFAYEKTVDYGNGYLFDYNEGRGSQNESRAYNAGSNSDQFMMQHFGYSMRYGKLTQPDSKVDRGLMQRQFNTWLKKRGVLSGRMLDVKADYDRKFILTDSAIGRRIDEALNWFDEQHKTSRALHNPEGNIAQGSKKNPRVDAIYDVQKIIADKFDYLSRRYLLEAIKAQAVIPHIKEHMALGRKVVVFHDYNKGGGFNPFDIQPRSQGDESQSGDINAINGIIREFRLEFKDLIESDALKASSPIDTFKKAFPGVLIYNGTVSPKEQRAAVEKFQDDASGPQIILGQAQAMKEGISLHDTTGKHQRVLFNLGQPTQPTTAIQQEGRIYRTGQVTDALFRYLNTGTNWEKYAFARDIATRSSTAENLGMGEQARALKDAFITGFDESDDYRAGMENEGKGGKERDKAANNALTEYDRARAFYFGTQKKNSRTKAQEGSDYFATPEPVGLMMVQLADIRIGESVLEPSAGHGAIARWMPENAERTAVEPSMSLRPRLAMVFDGKIVDSNFEDLNVINKYDAIVMNPPFGSAGRTAVDHIAKAATHLRDGGRIVALLPVGSATTKFDKWFYEKSERSAKPVFDNETFGKIYKGDTVITDSEKYAEAIVVGKSNKGNLFVKFPGDADSMPLVWGVIKSIKSTGSRTEEYSPAKGLNLVAEILMPSVTFERAGTAVNTRIVVIEKSANAPQQTNRDYSDIADINELFDRMENLSIPQRTKAQTDVQPDTPQKTSKPVVDKAAAKEAADAAGLEIIEHTTGKGKVIRGVVRTDLTLNQAKEIDKFTFKKDGGYFIREKHLVANNDGDVKFSQSTTKANNPYTLSTLATAIDKAMGRGFTNLLKATGMFNLIESSQIGKFLGGGAKFSKSAQDHNMWNDTYIFEPQYSFDDGSEATKSDYDKYQAYYQYEDSKQFGDLFGLGEPEKVDHAPRVNKFVPINEYQNPTPSKFLTQENIDNISRAILAVKKGLLGTQAFNKIVADNLPLPPESERGSNMVGDIYVGSVESNLNYHFGEYLSGLGIPYIDPFDGKQAHFYRVDWSKKEIVKRGDEYYVTSPGSNSLTGGYKSEAEAIEQYGKTYDGRGMTIGDGGGASFYTIGGGQLEKEPHLYDRIAKEFRTNPAKLLRSVKDEIVGRVDEQAADLWFFDEAIKDVLEHNYNETPEGRRAAFKVIDGKKDDIRYSKDGRILAFVISGQTYLVADNISSTDDNVTGLLKHEIGVHALSLGRNEPEFQAILKQIEVMRKAGNKQVQAARDRVPKDTPAHLVLEETAGYLVEQAPNLSISQKLIAWFRTQIRKLGANIKGSEKLKFFQWANTLTPEDIVAMAHTALRSAPTTLQNAQDRGTFKAEQVYADTYEVQPDTTRNLPIDGATLVELRRAAAGIETPEKGITFTVNADGKAIVTGPARVKVPARFQQFANEHGLTLVVQRGKSDGITTIKGEAGVKGRRYDPSGYPLSDANQYGASMPIEYRESGALYFGEMGEHIDRTGKTRFSKSESNPGTDSSKGQSEQTFHEWMATAEIKNNAASKARDWVSDALMPTEKGNFNWLHKTVVTQLHKARALTKEGFPQFERVFNLGQKFMNDITMFAQRAEAHAPNLLPRSDSLKGFFKNGVSRADSKLIANALNAGTLEGGTDPRSGVVWSDEQLKEKFKMSKEQIGYYREARAAIDQSLDDMTLSEIIREMRVANVDERVYAPLSQVNAPLAKVAQVIDATLERMQERFDLAGHDVLPIMELRGRISLQVKDVNVLKKAGYAPLMRFGRYTVTGYDGDGSVSHFFMFESKSEALRAERLLKSDKEISKVVRGEYNDEQFKLFKGISPSTIETFASHSSLKMDKVFQDFLKMAVANRSAMKRMIHRQGTAGFDNDATRALAAFIMSNSRRVSSNINSAAMNDAVMAIPKEQGKVKDEAADLVEYIQNPTEEAVKFRGFMFAQYLGGSIAAGMVNMTQPVLMTFPYLSQFGVKNAAAHMATGMKDTANWFRKQDVNDAGLQHALTVAQNRGITAPQEIFQMIAAAQGASSSFYGHKFMRLWGSNFAMTEAFNRVLTFSAAYRIGREMTPEALKKAGFKDIFEFAERAVEDTQGIYNKGNRPNWARGAVGATVFTFKQYSISYMEFLKRMYGDGKIPKKQFVVALSMLVLAAGLGGLPGADDLDDLIETMGHWMGYATNAKKWKRQVLTDLLGADAADFALNGVSTLPFMPLDVHGRLGMQNLIPGTGMFNPAKKDKTREVTEVFGVAGSFAQSILDALDNTAKGNYSGAAKNVLPKAIKDAYQAAEMYSTGQYKDTQGRKVMKATEGDALVKAIGFQPAAIAEETRKMSEIRSDIEIVKSKKTEIYSKLAHAKADKDQEARSDTMQEVRQWNIDNPDMKIMINHAAIDKKVHEIKATKADRFIKSTPKEMRQRVRQGLADD